MALNKYMHPRNPYKTKKPNFKELAIKYPEFREKVTQNLTGKVILDFKDPEALRALTITLLKNDFGLTVSLPVDRLIPTVPQRLNYILWLEDIFNQKKDLRGIDIGTGASCIYPLLGCRQDGWSFLASEVDDQNLVFSRKNVQQNNMVDKITVKKVEEDTLLLGLIEDNTSYDFCMCNPPFYSDHLEAQGITTSRSDDRPEPMSVSTASEVESISWGGEVKFVSRMIEESLVLKNRIRVYTSLLGKKMNLALLKDELQRKKITRFSSTEFCQGRTMRWGLAWTFDDNVHFPKSAFKSLKSAKPPITYTISRDNPTVTDYTVQAFTKYMRDTFDELKIKYNIIHSGKFYTAMNLQAKENTWSHQRKKRRQKQREEFEHAMSATETEGTTGDKKTDVEKNDLKDDEGISNEMFVTETENIVNKETSREKNDQNSDDTLVTESKEACNQETGIVNNEKPELKRGKENSDEVNKVHLVSQCKSYNVTDNNVEGVAQVQNQTTENNESVNENDQNCDRKDIEKGVCELCSNTSDINDELTDSNCNNSASLSPKPKEMRNENVEVAQTDIDKGCTGCKRKLENPGSIEQNLKKQRLNSDIMNYSDKAVSSNQSASIPTIQETNKLNEIELPMEEKVCAIGIANSGDKLLDNVESSAITENSLVAQSNPPSCGDTSNQPKLNDPSQVTHLRKDVVEEFHKEKEHNKEIEESNKDQSKKTKYHNFDESEDCLVMFKMVLRKEDGIITLTMEHKVGNKEAMHQIMQYFKNKFSTVSP